MPAPKAKSINGYILPEYVRDVHAIAEFTRVTKLLDSKVNQLDLSLLIDYAQTHGDIIRLRSVVTNEGEVLISDKTGSAYPNPRMSILLNKIGHLSKLRDDLFFTPKSRKEKQNGPKKKNLAESLAEEDDS